MINKVKEVIRYLKTQVDFSEREKTSDELLVESREVLSNAALLTQDVAESLLRELQSAVFDSSRKIKYVGDLLPDALITTDIKGNIETFSFGAVKLFGWVTGEIVGKDINILCPENDAHLCSKSMHCPFETTGIKKTGEKLPIEISTTEMELSDGTIRCLYLMRDISIRKANEAEILKYKTNLEEQVEERTYQLNEHKEMYKTLSRVSPVGIFRTNSEGDCIYVNKRWVEIAGISSEEAMGSGWIKAVHPDDINEVVKVWKDAHKNKLPHAEVAFRFLHDDGKVMFVLGQGNIVNGGNHGYVGTITKLSMDRRTSTNEIDEERRKQDCDRRGISCLSMKNKWLDNT